MTSSNGNIFRVTSPLCGEFTGHWWIPLTNASDAQLWCFPWSVPERLSKQLRRWWFEMPLHSLWRHCNATNTYQDHPNIMRWFIAIFSIRELQTWLDHYQHYTICSVIQMVHNDAPDRCNNTQSAWWLLMSWYPYHQASVIITPQWL